MRSSPWGWSFRNTCDVLSTAVRKTPFKSSSWARNSSSNSRKCLVLWGHTNTGTFSRTLATMGFWNILNYRWFLNEGFDIYEKIYIFFHNHLQFDLGLLYFPNKISWSIFKCLIAFLLQNFFATFTVTLDWKGEIGAGWPRCEMSSASSRSDSQWDSKASKRVGDRIVFASQVRNFRIFLEMSI